MKGIVQPLSSIGSTQTTDTLQVDDFLLISDKPSKKVTIPKNIEIQGVYQMSGEELVKEDIKQENYTISSEFIVFPPSYDYLFGKSIGYIGIQNHGEHDCVVVSRRRFSPAQSDDVSYVIKSNDIVHFSYQGFWCIEICQGETDKLEVVDFKTWGGQVEYNYLGMCN
eukprot:TRINITY_DN3625_c0_g1_i5.p1 TRINITY_DN3625_c0_g1~~TRINITY_DN3625_c0_g1_i5.p1  ORF type:complete len:167 (-),score=25.83 TRINITY_DN3625_c0_g1_i5:38-538(-)